MDRCIKKISCKNCIWNDQCGDEKPCSFYDDGSSDIDLSDTEIMQRVKLGRIAFRNEYWIYEKEYDDGKFYG